MATGVADLSRTGISVENRFLWGRTSTEHGQTGPRCQVNRLGEQGLVRQHPLSQTRSPIWLARSVVAKVPVAVDRCSYSLATRRRAGRLRMPLMRCCKLRARISLMDGATDTCGRSRSGLSRREIQPS